MTFIHPYDDEQVKRGSIHWSWYSGQPTYFGYFRRGGDGKDTIIGGAGQDKLYGDGNNDKFDSKDGSKDTVKGGAGTDSILQKDSNDVLESVP